MRSADPPMGGSRPASGDEAKSATFQKNVLPFLKTHCLVCHGAGKGKPKADLSFAKYTDDASVVADRKLWDTVQQMLKSREMPPPERPQPKADEIDAVSAAIQAIFDRADATAKPNAGRVTMRRLNRTEYGNTIRDLVGVDFNPSDDFPADDVGYGFDNIGDVLTVSPLLLEKYLSAAEIILDEAIVIADPPKRTKQTFDKFRTGSTVTASELGKVVSFEAGEYRVRLTVGGERTENEPLKVMLRVMGEDVKSFHVTATADKPEVIEATLKVRPGTGRVGVAFLNPDPDKAVQPAPGDIPGRPQAADGPHTRSAAAGSRP
jgi:mono/diheme cytochrome c family protein